MIGFSFESLNNLSSDNQNNTSSERNCSKTQTENEYVEIIPEDNSLVVFNNTTNKEKGNCLECKEYGFSRESLNNLSSDNQNNTSSEKKLLPNPD